MYLTQSSYSDSITKNASISNSLTYRGYMDGIEKLSLTRNKYLGGRNTRPSFTENKNKIHNKERMYLTDATDFFLEVLFIDDIDDKYVRLEDEEDFKFKKESLTNKYNRIRD